jgi:hypothetical protein
MGRGRLFRLNSLCNLLFRFSAGGDELLDLNGVGSRGRRNTRNEEAKKF